MKTKTYYKAVITETSHDQIFNKQTIKAKTMDLLIKKLQEHYGDFWKQENFTPSYRDIEGQTTLVGFCLEFENMDWAHSPVKEWNSKWHQVDWVLISHVEELNQLPSEIMTMLQGQLV